MAVGPVQLPVLGFPEPVLHGEIIAVLERLRETATVHVVDTSAACQGDAVHVEVARVR